MWTSLLYKHMIKHNLQSMMWHYDAGIYSKCPLSIKYNRSRLPTTAMPKQLNRCKVTQNNSFKYKSPRSHNKITIQSFSSWIRTFSENSFVKSMLDNKWVTERSLWTFQTCTVPIRVYFFYIQCLLLIDCKSYIYEHVDVSISLLARAPVPEGVSQSSLLVSLLHK